MLKKESVLFSIYLIENENNFFDDIFKDTKYTKKELKIIFDTFLKEQIAL